MARISPFSAWRFNSEKVPKVGAVISPPYDRIDSSLQQEIAARGDLSILMVMPGNAELSANNIDQLAARASETISAWQEERFLAHDPEPGIYYYRQGFVDCDGRHRVRKGFFALLDLEPEHSDVVLPQESDWTNPRVERLKLLEATEMAVAPIMLLFSDPEREVMSLLAGVAGDVEACIDTECKDETTHSVFRLTDPETIARVQELMAPQTVILADGHHRYRTAQAFAAAHPEIPAAHRILACFVPLEDDGLSLRPIHRAVTGLPEIDPNDLLFKLSQIFYIRELEERKTSDELLAHIQKEMARDDEHDEATFAAAIAGVPGILLLSVKTDAAKLALPEGLAEPIRDMDVSLLHRLVLEGPLGLDPSDRSKGVIRFFHEPEKLLSLVRDGETQAAFLLNPPAVRSLNAVVNARLKLPHKAARFYPDIPAGLVMQKLTDDGSNGDSHE